MCNERCSSNSSACASTMHPAPSLQHPLLHSLSLSLSLPFSLFRRPSISPTCKRRRDLSGNARTRNAGSACVQVHVRCTYAAACACTRTPRKAGEARMSSPLERTREREEEKEREAAGSDRPKEGRRRNAGWKSVREGQLPVCFSRSWNGELDEERKGRESQEVEAVGGGGR